MLGLGVGIIFRVQDLGFRFPAFRVGRLVMIVNPFGGPICIWGCNTAL